MSELKMSPEVDKIFPALVKAQSTFGRAKKDGTNPLFRSNFATLDAVIDAVKEPLYENGLTLLQPVVHHPDGIGLISMLIHESGQWIQTGPMVFPADIQQDKSGQRIGRTDVQACGSTVAYMRRYSVLALLFLAQEDDDGDTAGPRTETHTATRGVMATEKQIKMFYALTRKLGLTDDAIQLGIDARGHEGSSFNDLTSKQASEILSSLKDQAEGSDDR